eukprot:TRINITY_DN3607_c0_g1_i1.p1 TRINITY_DN3607_c0_g1~~TRINITY_DN3607_c0_g1_i1.p1  ORF type:complete len:426 (+),score=192.40 TRINITY_DN3607_c0_g1_i1:203-1480(+)
MSSSLLHAGEPPQTTGFEGPEKRLEVTFTYNKDFPLGLRSINKNEWQEMLDLVRCTIISSTSNQAMDSYVLSESSLFVSNRKIMLKTCGTTTLLNCIDKLEEYGRRCGSEISFISFSRKNFNFPDLQVGPHVNFEVETELLAKRFPTGSAHVLGPVFGKGDHHFIFFAHPLETSLSDSDDSCGDHEAHIPSPSEVESEVTLEVLMSDLSEHKMAQFVRQPGQELKTSKQATIDCGLADLLPEMESDEFLFDPCGYSLNAINTNERQAREDANQTISAKIVANDDRMPNYATVHITPESHCSFVSFEANMRVFGQLDSSLQAQEARTAVVRRVIDLFHPGRFSVVASSTSDMHAHFFKIPHIPGYICKFKTHYEYEYGFQVTMMNFVKNDRSASVDGFANLRASGNKLTTINLFGARTEGQPISSE